MIVRMSKIEIAGPRELLESVLSLLRDMGLLEIEPSAIGFVEKKDEVYIDAFIPDNSALSEKMFLEELRSRIDELLACLPSPGKNNRYLEPRSIIYTISETLQRHLPACKKLYREKEELQKELAELSLFNFFLDAVEPLLEDMKKGPDLDFIGLTLKDPAAEMILRKALSHLSDDKFELLTSIASDGAIVGLIALQKNTSARIKKALSDKNIPELRFPPSFGDLPFVEKVSFLKKRTSEISGELDMVHMQLDSFSLKWGAIYKRVRDWIEERLSLFKATASAFVTRMCFFIYGWMATEDVEKLREDLNRDFTGKVLLEELEIREEDLERMPVILRNPAYFKPFELFTRILPLPRYTSYDPTPFIGIFFPVFFGMILGDAGYGSIIIIVSLLILKRAGKNKTVQNVCKILVVSAFYAIIFGILYGEFFGELGQKLFGLTPLLVERRTAVMPMLFFSVSVGIVHVLLGTFLGFIIALKKRTKKEALLKFIHILFILCIVSLVAAIFGFFPGLMTRPMILTILFITPFLFFAGGVLAPLEVLKSIGNIISYARIMAIGLTSVLLASVANRLAGMTGDIILGVVVAGLLHLLNIIIGVFSPTIHSLRLHYVEFFNKFIESGGRRFEPFKKNSKEVI
jgi:V/A-type H+-transporting ATPase subunit I